MTAKEYVRSKYHAAHVDNYKGNGPFGKRYYICWSNHGTGRQRLGEGDKASKAWTDARRNIVEQENIKKK